MKLMMIMIMMITVMIFIMKIQFITDRSWHSLKERYRKRIVPNLHIYQRYGLHKTMLERFKSKGDLQPMEGEELEVKVEEEEEEETEREKG